MNRMIIIDHRREAWAEKGKQVHRTIHDNHPLIVLIQYPTASFSELASGIYPFIT